MGNLPSQGLQVAKGTISQRKPSQLRYFQYNLPGNYNYTHSISLKKKKKAFCIKTCGGLLESELKDKDSILLHNNKGIMYKIPQNYKLTKFRDVLGGEMKGKMKPFEQLQRAV